MEKTETIFESCTSTEENLPDLRLKTLEDELLKCTYHYAKRFSILAGNTQKDPDGDNFKETSECLSKIRNTRWNYEKFLEKKKNDSFLKATIVKIDSLKLLKSGIPESFKIGIIELVNRPSKAFLIDTVLYDLESKGVIKGIADMYLNYAIASAALDLPPQKWEYVDSLLDLSTMYKKKEGTEHKAYFSFMPNNESPNRWMARSIDFPFYPPTKIAVWL